jgi:hypothetical protein
MNLWCLLSSVRRIHIFVHASHETWILHCLCWDACLGQCTEWKIPYTLNMEKTVLQRVIWDVCLDYCGDRNSSSMICKKISFSNECWDNCLVQCILHAKDCFRESTLSTLPISVSETFPTNFAKKISSPLCILRRTFRPMRWKNIFLHNSKEKSCSPLCIRRCLLTPMLWVNLLENT